ncbi:MAG TPA: GNAT family protein [Ilumatobacteraceae bacterium]
MDRLPDTMHTPRLILRQWCADDAAKLADAITRNVEHLRPWMPWIAAEPQTTQNRLSLILQWQSEWERGGDLVVGAFQDGDVVGSAGLHRRRGPGVLEIGYWIDVGHVRNGFATEIASTLTTLAFTVDGIERVEIHHDKANVASGGIPRRLGYTLAGETPDSITSPGEVGIDCRWTIDRQVWLDNTAMREVQA